MYRGEEIAKEKVKRLEERRRRWERVQKKEKRGREREREMGKKSERRREDEVWEINTRQGREKKHKRFNRIRRMKGLFYEGTGERSGKKVRRGREREGGC